MDELNFEQRECFERIESSKKNFWITGSAGTGKSRLLRYLKHHSNKNFVVLAPTGIAALNIQGQTIHSFFKLPQGFLHEQSRISPVEELNHIDGILIDEISMVRADVFETIDKICKQSLDSSDTFGGLQIVMFGDVFQIRPVVKPEFQKVLSARFGEGFFFETQAFQEGNFEVIELREQMRFQDMEFFQALERVRVGEVSGQDLEYFNRRVVETFDDDCLILTPRRATANQINKQKLDELPTQLFTFKGELKLDSDALDQAPEIKTFYDLNRLRKDLPTPQDLSLKKDAQVVMLNNHPNDIWRNGTVCKIADISYDHISVEIRGITYDVEPHVWQWIYYKYDPKTNQVQEIPFASFRQYPLALGWAMTIHKAQGLTLNKVAIYNDQPMFAHGQLYVALSRVRRLEDLFLLCELQPNDVRISEKVKAFYSSFLNQ